MLTDVLLLVAVGGDLGMARLGEAAMVPAGVVIAIWEAAVVLEVMAAGGCRVVACLTNGSLAGKVGTKSADVCGQGC